MGSYFNRNNAQNEEQEEIIEENNNEQINNLIAPNLKAIIKVKNPFFLLKETMHLDKDSIKNIYYIKFKYDSIINFNCYINFNVKENLQRNNLKQKDDYELFYIPTDKFVEKNIVINNLQKGKNQEFYYKDVFLDFDYFEQNTTRIKEEHDEYEEEEEEEDDDDNNNNNNNNQIIENKANIDEQNKENESLINNNNENINYNEENKNNNNEINDNEYEEIYDIGIEFIPYYEEDSDDFKQNKDKNEIVLISLFNIDKKENNEIEIKCVLQKLKKHNYFFELKDIYDGAGNNGKCVICYTNNRNTIFLPCRHSSCCQNCSGTLMPKVCPLCKENIQDIICLYRDLGENNNNESDKDNKNETNLNENGGDNKGNNNNNQQIQSINEA